MEAKISRITDTVNVLRNAIAFILAILSLYPLHLLKLSVITHQATIEDFATGAALPYPQTSNRER